MNKALYTLLLFFFLFSCSKETVTDYELLPPEDSEVVLTIQSQTDPSKIHLSWTPYRGTDFERYDIVRRSMKVTDGEITEQTGSVASISDAERQTFTDDIGEGMARVSYHIAVRTGGATSRKSNVVDITPLPPYHDVLYRDVLISTEHKLLYFLEFVRGTITAISYQGPSKVVATDSLFTGIGYGTLGHYNGHQELYVPASNGWLHIYDAGTLQHKERFLAGGESLRSVAATGGKLFVSSNDGTHSANFFKVYNRQDKQLLSSQPSFYEFRAIHMEQSAPAEFVGIMLSSPGLLSFKTTSENTITYRQISLSGSQRIDPDITRSFPDGSRFISSARGNIFSKDGVYEKSLPAVYVPNPFEPMYADFAFSADGRIIYAAHAGKREIAVIRYPEITTERIIPTSQFPARIFRDGNQLIAVTKVTSQYQRPAPFYFLIEKIDL